MYEAVNHRLWEVTSGFTQWKINSAWPDVQWQIFDWFLKPMVSYYFIKRANEPVHVQLGLLEPTVTVINRTLEPRKGLKVRARILDPLMRVLVEKEGTVDIGPDCYHDVFELPKPTLSAPIYFVRLDLSGPTGDRVSDNLYWFPAQKGGSMERLRALTLVKVFASGGIVPSGQSPGRIARVRVTNPTSQIAFFVQLAFTREPDGTEILPVLWEDNYFSLLPGESREIEGRYSERDAGTSTPALEVGGWNVETDYRCQALEMIPAELKAGQAGVVSARIANTFLDGSRVLLSVDGGGAGTAWAWARYGTTDTVRFPVRFETAGTHELAMGTMKVQVTVQP